VGWDRLGEGPLVGRGSAIKVWDHGRLDPKHASIPRAVAAISRARAAREACPVPHLCQWHQAALPQQHLRTLQVDGILSCDVDVPFPSRDSKAGRTERQDEAKVRFE
jgi:hypothetical protein